MAKKKTVTMWSDDFETVLTDIPNLRFLDFDEEKPEIRANTLEVKGKDGVLVGKHSFAPFQLILRFWYAGSDLEDYNLMKQRLRSILFRKDVFYICHSDRPGIRYAVYTEDNAIEDIGNQYGTFEVTFNCYKGFSESISSTLSIDNLDFLTDDTWQWEQNLITDRDIKYKHTNKRFEIWNGGEEIDPLNHRFNIIIKNTDAPAGFRITNHMTNQTFQYFGKLQKHQVFTLNGVHPIIDGERVGINSNWDWINLQKQFNNIEIDGIGMTFGSVEFDFNYIFR